MKKITTFLIAAALAASMAVPTSAYGLLFSRLSFETNGGNEINTTLTTLGMKIDLSKYVTEREGYTFIGWFADEELTEAVTEIKAGSVSKLYAGWEEIVIEEPVEDNTEVVEGETTEGEVVEGEATEDETAESEVIEDAVADGEVAEDTASDAE